MTQINQSKCVKGITPQLFNPKILIFSLFFQKFEINLAMLLKWSIYNNADHKLTCLYGEDLPFTSSKSYKQ